MLKKRQSRRISSRKKHNLEKKNRTKAKKQSKLLKSKSKGRVSLPKSILLPDEELEILKKIKEDEKLRFINRREEEEEDSFKRLVRNNNVLLEVVDLRDPLGSINPKYQEYILGEGKDHLLVFGNRKVPLENELPQENELLQENVSPQENDVPQEIESLWKTHLERMGYKFYNNSTIERRVGIFGQKGTGKMYWYKQLNSPLVDKNLVRVEPSTIDFLSLLRNVTPLKTFFYSTVFNEFYSNLNKDDFCLYFGIEYCETTKGVENAFHKKFKIGYSKVFNFILEEFYKGKIKFWREGPDSKSIRME